MHLAQFLPLPDAANRLGMSVPELRARIEAGTMLAGTLPDGEIVVSMSSNGSPADDINTRLRAIRREDFEYLQGKAITISDASDAYHVPGTTIRDWVKLQYVTIVDPNDYPARLDELNLAYCAAIYKVRKALGIRAPLLDRHGNPYILKLPDLAQYRRDRKRTPVADRK